MKYLIIFLHTKYPAIIWTIIIFVLCTIPSEHIPISESISDKTNHFIAFAGFSFFWLFYFPKPPIVILIGIIYGIAIEFWQAILPDSFHRGFDWYDALADGIGGIIGYLIYLVFNKLAKLLL